MRILDAYFLHYLSLYRLQGQMTITYVVTLQVKMIFFDRVVFSKESIFHLSGKVNNHNVRVKINIFWQCQEVKFTDHFLKSDV